MLRVLKGADLPLRILIGLGQLMVQSRVIASQVWSSPPASQEEPLPASLSSSTVTTPKSKHPPSAPILGSSPLAALSTPWASLHPPSSWDTPCSPPPPGVASIWAGRAEGKGLNLGGRGQTGPRIQEVWAGRPNGTHSLGHRPSSQSEPPTLPLRASKLDRHRTSLTSSHTPVTISLRAGQSMHVTQSISPECATTQNTC